MTKQASKVELCANSRGQSRSVNIRSHIVSGIIAFLLVVAVLITGSLAATTAAARVNILDENRGVLSVASIIEQASPAVVNISVASRVPASQNPLFRDPYFRRFFGVPEEVPEREALSAGSGVIVDANNGYVLTNHHVIDNADRITVRLKDGRQFDAKLIGSDAATDIGLLQIDAEKLSALPFDEQYDLKVGDFVLAIGNPFGLGQTVTSGIISALGRSGISRDKYEDFIQTDAPINPGNSGGALINTRGELVGINTAIIAPGGGNVGIGFAVPTVMARAVMDQLLEHGEVRRGRLGIAIQDITPDIAQALSLPTSKGALVSKVEPDSPAEEAGLKAGDAIVKLNEQTIVNSNALRARVGLLERGTSVRLVIIRDGKEHEVSARIGEVKPTEIIGGSSLRQLAGARFTEIPEDRAERDGLAGVYVSDVSPGSPAWQLGLRSGDVILAVNRQRVTSVAEFDSVTKSIDGVLAFNILRNDTQLFIVMQ